MKRGAQRTAIESAKGSRGPRSQRPRAASPSRALSPGELLAAAIERGADLTLIDKLIALQERAERTAARTAFEEAMAEVRAELPPIKRNRRAATFAGLDRRRCPSMMLRASNNKASSESCRITVSRCFGAIRRRAMASL